MPNAMTMTRVTFIILILTTWVTLATGQNLVPNSSFEIYTACPGPYWPNDVNKAAPWYNPTTCSPDYFDTCAAAVSAGVGSPNNWIGYQNAHTGVAYVGTYVWASSGQNSREYIQVKLLDSLRSGQQYCVSFYVSLGVSPSGYNYAITEMGLLLSNNSITTSNYYYLPYIPQITSPPGVFLTDTLNWTMISGTYTALGGEQYITIGNFKTDVNTDSLNFMHTSPSGGQAYYYIDDVSIYECVTGISEIVVSNKTTVYPNPFNSSATIQFSNTKKEICTLTLYDLHGQIVRTINNIASDQVVIQKNDLTNGLYYFVLRTSDNVVGTGKLSVE